MCSPHTRIRTPSLTSGPGQGERAGGRDQAGQPRTRLSGEAAGGPEGPGVSVEGQHHATRASRHVPAAVARPHTAMGQPHRLQGQGNGGQEAPERGRAAPHISPSRAAGISAFKSSHPRQKSIVSPDSEPPGPKDRFFPFCPVPTGLCLRGLSLQAEAAQRIGPRLSPLGAWRGATAGCSGDGNQLFAVSAGDRAGSNGA